MSAGLPFRIGHGFDAHRIEAGDGEADQGYCLEWQSTPPNAAPGMARPGSASATRSRQGRQ